MKRILLILLFIASNCSASLTGSIVGWWKMNDNLGSTVVIDSAGSNDGTFSDATGNPNTNTHNTAGKVSGALIFDGVDDYTDIGDTSQNVKSVSLWIKQDDVGGNEYAIDLDGSSYLSVESGVVTITGFTTPQLYVNGIAGTSGVTTITADTWNYIVITDTTQVDADNTDIGRVTVAPSLGTEKVQTPSLAVSSPPAGWTLEGDWFHENSEYIGHKEAAWTGNEDTYPTMVTAVIASTTYRVTANFQALTVTNGGVTVSLGGGSKFPAQGSNSWDITAINTNGLVINIEGAGVTTDVELVSVSVKEIITPEPAYFAGSIDNVMIFDTALSVYEIIYLYNGGTGFEELGQRNIRGRYSGNVRTRYNIN